MSAPARTVEEYLDALPPERADVVRAVRDAVVANLPDGYEETTDGGIISYVVPLARYPTTYNGKPLQYVAIAAQKHHYAVYLNGVYASPDVEQQLRDVYARSGTKLDLGKSCLRFRRLDGVELEALSDVVAAVPVEKFIELYEASRSRSR